MRKLSETNVLNKTIALRVDLNVPVENDNVLDDTRILAIIPTLEYLLAQNTKIILISHFGRPKSGVFDSKFSLLPVEKLSRQTTLFPSSINTSHKFDPIKPAPPVTKIFLFFNF